MLNSSGSRIWKKYRQLQRRNIPEKPELVEFASTNCKND